jgi:hypothetical protein
MFHIECLRAQHGIYLAKILLACDTLEIVPPLQASPDWEIDAGDSSN